MLLITEGQQGNAGLPSENTNPTDQGLRSSMKEGSEADCSPWGLGKQEICEKAFLPLSNLCYLLPASDGSRLKNTIALLRGI